MEAKISVIGYVRKRGKQLHYKRKLITKILHAANVIAMKSKSGPGTFVRVSKSIGKMLGKNIAGMEVIVDSWRKNDEIIVGRDNPTLIEKVIITEKTAIS